MHTIYIFLVLAQRGLQIAIPQRQWQNSTTLATSISKPLRPHAISSPLVRLSVEIRPPSTSRGHFRTGSVLPPQISNLASSESQSGLSSYQTLSDTIISSEATSHSVVHLDASSPSRVLAVGHIYSKTSVVSSALSTREAIITWNEIFESKHPTPPTISVTGLIATSATNTISFSYSTTQVDTISGSLPTSLMSGTFSPTAASPLAETELTAGIIGGTILEASITSTLDLSIPLPITSSPTPPSISGGGLTTASFNNTISFSYTTTQVDTISGSLSASLVSGTFSPTTTASPVAETGLTAGIIGGTILGASAIAGCLVLFSRWYRSQQIRYNRGANPLMSYFSD